MHPRRSTSFGQRSALPRICIRVAYLLMDLMHWAEKCRLSFTEQLRRAEFRYAAEMAEKEAA